MRPKFIKSTILKIFLFSVTAAAVILTAACSSTVSAQNQNAKADKPATDFVLSDLNGRPVALSDYRGKPVFFNYWASWCPACVGEMPIIQSVYADWGKRGLVLFTVNAGEDLGTIQNFMQKNHYTFPVLVDTQGDVGSKYNVYSIPISAFVDRQGDLKNQVIGAFPDKEALEKQLSGIVAQ